jgi:integrative and conjugative element protein (TIGR02256 family)
VTDGPDLAERQLRELAAGSGGSVEVLATHDTAAGRWFTILMDTSGLPAGAGIRIETGGMLLGAFDDAAGVIYVDRATGPPPDSFLSATYFQHGQAGTREAVAARLETSRAMTGFAGYWHTHPGGSAAPSLTDEEGMASVVTPAGRRQRALMIIIGGRDGQWDRWVAGTGARPAVFARVVPRGEEITRDGAGSFPTQRLPAGAFFRGGFSGPALVTGHEDPGGPGAACGAAGQARWWQWRRGHGR